jgi:hypothetical protein
MLRRSAMSVKGCRVDWQEKLTGEDSEAPYRKPTQVGKASSLR